MTPPRFSILLPSRNRLGLLRLAIESILRQGRTDIEIVVSDNASDESYETFAASVRGPQVVYSRSDVPLSVTANWNRALELSSGDYVIMLGDDDALTPGLLDRLESWIDRFEEPDCLYIMGFNYAYPDVFPGRPAGYFCAVNNSRMFDGRSEAFLLPKEEARRSVADGLRFHHSVSFNAQHFIWKRSYLERVSESFFQSPYPDYYACFVTFATAERIAIVPNPEIIIGISKQSFGFFFANGRENEGFLQFEAPDVDAEALSQGDPGILQALRFPGSRHYRNWLCAALAAKATLVGIDLPSVDIARYRTIQLYDTAFQAGFARTIPVSTMRRFGRALARSDRARLSALIRAFRAVRQSGQSNTSQVGYGMSRVLGIHFPPTIIEYDIGHHETIIDAFAWLDHHGGPALDSASTGLRELDPKDSHIEKLTRALISRDQDLARLGETEAAAAAKDQHIQGLDAAIASLRAELEEQRRRGEAALAAKDQHIEGLDAAIASLGAELYEQRRQGQAAVTAKDQHIEGLDGAIASLRAELYEQRRQGQAAVAAKDQHIQGLDGAVISLRAELYEQRRQGDAAIAAKSQHIEGLDAAIASLRAELEAVALGIEELRT